MVKQISSQFRRLGSLGLSGTGSLLVYRMTLFLLYPHVKEETKELPGATSHRTLIAIVREELINSLSLNFQMTSGLRAASAIVTCSPNSMNNEVGYF